MHLEVCAYVANVEPNTGSQDTKDTALALKAASKSKAGTTQAAGHEPPHRLLWRTVQMSGTRIDTKGIGTKATLWKH